MPVYLIAACSRNRVIGREGALPWRLEKDLAYVRGKLQGGVGIEGRRAYEEFAAPLPGAAHTIVLTRRGDWSAPGVECAGSLPEALQRARQLPADGPVWICGGEAVYAEAMPLADLLYLTLIHAWVEGDTYLPDWRTDFGRVLSRREEKEGRWRFTFYVLGRSRQAQPGYSITADCA